MSPGVLKGTIHGKTIQLDEGTDLPDGQTVAVTLRATLPAGEGLRRAFGAWSDEPAELDQFFEDIRRDHDQDRPEPGA